MCSFSDRFFALSACLSGGVVSCVARILNILLASFSRWG
jgi:hypothetical protein